MTSIYYQLETRRKLQNNNYQTMQWKLLILLTSKWAHITPGIHLVLPTVLLIYKDYYYV